MGIKTMGNIMTQLCELNHGKRNDTAMQIKPWET